MTVLDGDNSSCSVAGIPRRRHVHGHQHRLAKNGYNLTSDTRYFLAKTREEIARVGRKIVAVFGESVSVSASWNASMSQHDKMTQVLHKSHDQYDHLARH